MAIKLIIFDYDGVLVDSLDVVLAIYRKIGKEFNVEEFKNLKDGNLFNVDWRKTIKEVVGITNDGDLKNYEKFFMQERIKLNQQIKPFPKIKEAVKNLRKDYRLAIVSNNYTDFIEQGLKKFGLLEYFDVIVGAEHGPLKPEPDLLHLCIKKIGVKEQEAVYIGDMEEDITAAKKANIKAVGASYGYHSEHKLKEADIILDSPEKLLQPIILKNGKRLL